VPIIAPVSVRRFVSFVAPTRPLSFATPKSRNHDRAVRREEHVVGLQIAMDDADAVRRREGRDDRTEDAEGLAGRQRAVARPSIGERLTFEEIHHEDGRAVLVLDDVVHRDDVRVAHGARGARLAQRALARGRVVVLLVDELERQRLARDEVRGRPYRAHPALAELPLEAVTLRDDLAGLHG
jgi:hypothetical protein